MNEYLTATNGAIALIVVLLGWLGIERMKRRSAEAEVKSGNLDKKDAVLEYRTEELKKDSEKLESDLARLEEEKDSPDLDIDAILDFWNKKNGK